MECDFEIRHIPCPPEREAEYRKAIKLIAKLIRAELEKAPQNALLEKDNQQVDILPKVVL